MPAVVVCALAGMTNSSSARAIAVFRRVSMERTV
jgi:hypothetical protein